MLDQHERKVVVFIEIVCNFESFSFQSSSNKSLVKFVYRGEIYRGEIYLEVFNLIGFRT